MKTNLCVLIALLFTLSLKTSGQGVITIPTVVHVIYHYAPSDSISDAQIFSEIIALNKAFRKQNADTFPPSHPFAQYAGDAMIEFCLAQRDPNNQPTTGITWKKTTNLNLEVWTL